MRMSVYGVVLKGVQEVLVCISSSYSIYGKIINVLLINFYSNMIKESNQIKSKSFI